MQDSRRGVDHSFVPGVERSPFLLQHQQHRLHRVPVTWRVHIGGNSEQPRSCFALYATEELPAVPAVQLLQRQRRSRWLHSRVEMAASAQMHAW